MRATQTSVETSINECTRNYRAHMVSDFNEINTQHGSATYAGLSNVMFDRLT